MSELERKYILQLNALEGGFLAGIFYQNLNDHPENEKVFAHLKEEFDRIFKETFK